MTLPSDVKTPNNLLSRTPNYVTFPYEDVSLRSFNEMTEKHKIMYTLDWINDTNWHYETSQVQNLKILK